MNVTLVIRHKWQVVDHYEKAQEFMHQKQWKAAIIQLAEVLGWDWPVHDCSEELHMKLQDHLVWCLGKAKEYVQMEDWCRRLLERRVKPQGLGVVEQGLHDRRTRYLWRELASSLQYQYDPAQADPTSLKKCLEAVEVLKVHAKEFESGQEDETLAYKEILAECLSKVGQHEEAISLGTWLLEKKLSMLDNLDREVIASRYNLACYCMRSCEWDTAESLYEENISVVANDPDSLSGSTPEWLDSLDSLLAATAKWFQVSDDVVEENVEEQLEEVAVEPLKDELAQKTKASIDPTQEGDKALPLLEITDEWDIKHLGESTPDLGISPQIPVEPVGVHFSSLNPQKPTTDSPDHLKPKAKTEEGGEARVALTSEVPFISPDKAPASPTSLEATKLQVQPESNTQAIAPTLISAVDATHSESATVHTYGLTPPPTSQYSIVKLAESHAELPKTEHIDVTKAKEVDPKSPVAMIPDHEVDYNDSKIIEPQTPRNSTESLKPTPVSPEAVEASHSDKIADEIWLISEASSQNLAPPRSPSIPAARWPAEIKTEDIESCSQIQPIADENLYESDDSANESNLDSRNQFFGWNTIASDDDNLTRDKDAKSWVKRFDLFGQKLFPRSSPYQGAGVKIAILDTGIDGEHPFIQQKWNKPIYGKKIEGKEIELKDGEWYKDFVSKKPEAQNTPTDADGHGTHVAGIIMQFAPDAELCIARIAKSSSSIGEDEGLGERVAAAINHATKFWGVDIISMSFGFYGPKQKELALMRRAISTADHDGVIIMAAASNHGNLADVPFPANDYRVLCINASNGYGRRLEFSPLRMSSSHDFSILGLDIMSTWPEFPKLKEDSKRKKGTFTPDGMEGSWKCLSGTSVATPMAAALAALLFQYWRMHIESGVEKEMSQLECLGGLTKVFEEMGRQDEAGLHNLVPWEGAGSGRFRTYERHMTGILKSIFGIYS